jgi:hypothetical protein
MVSYCRLVFATVLLPCVTMARSNSLAALQEIVQPESVAAESAEERSQRQQVENSLAELKKQAEESLHPIAGGLWALGLNQEWCEKIALSAEQCLHLKQAFNEQMSENADRIRQRTESRNLSALERKSVDERLQQLRVASHTRGAKELETLLTAEQRAKLAELLRASNSEEVVFADEISTHAGITQEQLIQLAKIWTYYTSEMDATARFTSGNVSAVSIGTDQFSKTMTELNLIRSREFWSVLTDAQAQLLAEKHVIKPKYVAAPKWLPLRNLIADGEQVVLRQRDPDTSSNSGTKSFSCPCILLRALLDTKKQAALVESAAQTSKDPRSNLAVIDIEIQRPWNGRVGPRFP